MQALIGTAAILMVAAALIGITVYRITGIKPWSTDM